MICTSFCRSCRWNLALHHDLRVLHRPASENMDQGKDGIKLKKDASFQCYNSYSLLSLKLTILVAMGDPSSLRRSHFRIKLCQSAALSFTFLALPVKLPFLPGVVASDYMNKQNACCFFVMIFLNTIRRRKKCFIGGYEKWSKKVKLVLNRQVYVQSIIITWRQNKSVFTCRNIIKNNTDISRKCAKYKNYTKTVCMSGKKATYCKCLKSLFWWHFCFTAVLFIKDFLHSIECQFP